MKEPNVLQVEIDERYGKYQDCQCYLIRHISFFYVHITCNYEQNCDDCEQCCGYCINCEHSVSLFELRVTFFSVGGGKL